MNRIIDLSHTITENMPFFPGDLPPQLRKVNHLASDGYNNYQLTTGMHIGTHIDGPMHLTDSTQFISQIPIEKFIGKGIVLNALNEKQIVRKQEYEYAVLAESIVLIYTNHSKYFGSSEYYINYPIVSRELAELFIEQKIKMLCLDFPSPDYHPYEIHKLLLENGILIAENLTNLDKLLEVKEFEVIVLTLNINADSSPARIIARVNS